MVPAMSKDDSSATAAARSNNNGGGVDFGFRRVSAMEKPRLVRRGL